MGCTNVTTADHESVITGRVVRKQMSGCCVFSGDMADLPSARSGFSRPGRPGTNHCIAIVFRRKASLITHSQSQFLSKVWGMNEVK
jgi:hypothetical protein